MSTQNISPPVVNERQPARQGSLRTGEHFQNGRVAIHFSPAESLYEKWPVPTCIISHNFTVLSIDALITLVLFK